MNISNASQIITDNLGNFGLVVFSILTAIVALALAFFVVRYGMRAVVGMVGRSGSSGRAYARRSLWGGRR